MDKNFASPKEVKYLVRLALHFNLIGCKADNNNLNKHVEVTVENIGEFGKLETFGQNYIRKFRFVYVLGFCPSGTSAASVALLQHKSQSAEWSTGIQDVSPVNRYIVATPKLTPSKKISPTSKIIKMCPIAGSIEKHFQKMSFDDWLKGLNFITSERGYHPAIVTKDFWIFD